MEELKPCPYAFVEKEYKHKPEIMQPEGPLGMWQVCCPCGFRSAILGFDKQEVIEMYNTRPIEDKLKELLDKVGDLIADELLRCHETIGVCDICREKALVLLEEICYNEEG